MTSNLLQADLIDDEVFAQMRFNDNVVGTVKTFVANGTSDLMYIGPYTINVEAESILIQLSPSNFSCYPPCYFNGLDVYDLNGFGSSQVSITNVELETNFSNFTGDRISFGDDYVSFNLNELICPIYDCEGVYINAYLTFSNVITTVDIDIMPKTNTNCINLDGRGVIPVAILGSEVFDVEEVDKDSLIFAGLSPRLRGKNIPMCVFKDVNHDGFNDLICQFEEDLNAWSPDNGYATLRGKLYDETIIQGTDEICTPSYGIDIE